LRVLSLQEFRRFEEIFSQNRKKFVFVRVCIIVEIGVIPGRMREFMCHVLHPMLDCLPGNLRGKTMVGLFFFNKVNELMNTHVVFARRVIESFEERPLGKNHYTAKVLPANQTKNVLIAGASVLVVLAERFGVDEYLTQSMIFPILETQDWNHRTGGDQDSNRLIDFGPDASDADLIEENFDELPESLFLMVWKSPKQKDVRLKYLLPRGRHCLVHDPQPA
jgi:hypothetical protein